MGKIFRTIHINLSLLFLPIALLYAITGSLYLSGYKQNSGAKTWEFTLPAMEQEKLPQAISEWLRQNSLKPIQNTTLQKGRDRSMVMGSAKYEATIKKSDEGYKVNVLERSFFGNLIMLHKGKGEWYFNILAYGFAASLIVFYISGLVMTSFCKKRRAQAVGIVILGFVLAFVLGYASL